MRAARLIAHSAPLRVEEVGLGVPGPSEVVVEMSFGGVNPVDRYIALGRVAPDAAMPRTMGVEGAGIAEGRPVVVHGTGIASTRDGVWAETAVVPRSAAVPVPDGVDLRHAAAMGVAGATAWKTVHDLARVGPGDRVLVLGASGGVGSMIVSLAASSGGEVWGQTGQERRARGIEEQGASHAVVATDPRELVPEASAFRPTVVIDPLGGEYTGVAIESLEAGGRLVLFGTSAASEGRVPLQALYRKGLSLLGYGGLSEPAEVVHDAMRHALEATREGLIRVRVDAVMDLDEVNDAFDRLESRQVEGKLLLSLAP